MPGIWRSKDTMEDTHFPGSSLSAADSSFLLMQILEGSRRSKDCRPTWKHRQHSQLLALAGPAPATLGIWEMN